jgi:dTDP-4-dehydrorhamnose reductase
MRVLVAGATGQVGWELRRSLAPLGEVIAPPRAELDLSRPESVAGVLARYQPTVIVNPGAYTAVDKAESEPELAEAVNTHSVAALAQYAARSGALLLHFSTDYVFDGLKTSAYEVDDVTHPVSAYGRSKLGGEQAIAASGCRHVILRTSWVYAPRGKNFLLTMLRLARERESLRVVADQFGAPTTARLLADVTTQLLARIPVGVSPPASLLHVSGAGRTSWHGFASRIVEWGAELGLCKAVPVEPIATTDYPTPAARPANSQLSHAAIERTYGLVMPDWQQSLRDTLEDLAASR